MKTISQIKGIFNMYKLKNTKIGIHKESMHRMYAWKYIVIVENFLLR